MEKKKEDIIFTRRTQDIHECQFSPFFLKTKWGSENYDEKKAQFLLEGYILLKAWRNETLWNFKRMKRKEKKKREPRLCMGIYG